MQKNLLIMSCVALTTVTSLAQADTDIYVGQTGQYHQVPSSTDVQKITLTGKDGYPCSMMNGKNLHAVDEFGAIESTPFEVPGNTVFLVTDAIFAGFNNSGAFGELPWLNVVQYNSVSKVPNPFEKASFLASTPLLTGKVGEYFAGQGSLASGAAFATGSMLCARASLHADAGASYYNMTVDSVVVHGTLIDNARTDKFPYLSW